MRHAAIILLTLCAALAVSALPAGDADPAKAGKSCSGTMEDCLSAMISRFKKTGLIGLDGAWDPELRGYRIEKFLEASVAEKAGIMVGDILVRINGIPLSDEKATMADVENRRPGNEVSVTVLRGEEPLTVTVTLIPVPADVMAREIGRHMLESHSPAAASGNEQKKD
jgi:membrane-associated protease RseP (regulator of RpoE activity)